RREPKATAVGSKRVAKRVRRASMLTSGTRTTPSKHFKPPLHKERTMSIDPNAGSLPEEHTLTNIPRLIARYYSERPDPSDPGQQVSFGTSGHRGSSLKGSFNEWHILAVTQAICDYRREQGIDGPLFVGMDTHALSEPAFVSALEVLAANGVETRIDAGCSETAGEPG